MPNFDSETLSALREVKEVAIRTEKHSKTRVVIWAVVVDDQVFIRSVYGPGGRWYRDLAAGGPATLEFSDREVTVEAVPEADPGAVEQASSEYLRKYRPSPYAQAMVKPEVLPTTLRLEPR